MSEAKNFLKQFLAFLDNFVHQGEKLMVVHLLQKLESRNLIKDQNHCKSDFCERRRSCEEDLEIQPFLLCFSKGSWYIEKP